MQNKENNEVKICTRCKREINCYDKTCYYCGEEFEVEYPDERAAYIQKNIGTYLRKFNKIESGDKASSWNWCAFLFTVDWLVYRKMYKLAVIVLVATVVIDLVAELVFFSVISNELTASLFSDLVTLAYCVFIGIMGDRWYKTRVDKLVEESAELPEEEKQKHYKKGGTNIIAVIVMVLLAGTINLLLQ